MHRRRHRSCVRATPEELAALNATTIGVPRRRGKFLLIPFARDGTDALVLAANPMLAGRFWLTNTSERVRARTGLRLRLENGGDLRYVDREMLGKLYLVPPDGAVRRPRLGRTWARTPMTRP